MPRIAFKYRITAVIFILAAIILAVVLSQSLSQYLQGSRNQLIEHEKASLKLLGEFARIALLTTDYDVFQPQLEHVANLSDVTVILLADDQGRIVATSEPAWIGQFISNRHVNTEAGWELLPLENMTGKLGTLAAQFSHEHFMLLHNQVRSMAIAWSLAGLSLIALISLLAGHLLTRRLAWIARAAEAVANGDLSARAAVDGQDEVAELGHVFDTMVEKIKNEHKQQEEREQYLSLTLDSIGDAVITTNASGYITRMNPVAENLTQWQGREARGRLLPEIFNIVNAHSRQTVSNPVEKVLATREITGLSNHTILISKQNTEYQIADSAAPIIDRDGEILGVILVFRDVTQQYQVEEALRRSQKMDAIGQLSGGIAHDFNNQLNIVLGYLEFLNDHFSETEKPYKWVQIATRAALRCTDLTRQLLSFSRHHAVKKFVLDLNSVFVELQTMIARSVTPEIEVEYCLQEDLWLTEANKGEFEDVIVNLVINARDAMPQGGKITIKTVNKTIDKDYISSNFEISSGQYAQLILSDTGSGIDKKSLQHIFEPFFTTKPEGKGTGLGLSMVYGFIKRYEGYINVYSEPGLGTNINIYLPRSKASATIKDRVSQDIELPRGNESVLIVDDETDLLELAETFLSELGYHTQICVNGTQALEILKTDRTIDLLFSDVIMPGGINGYELAQQATQLRPKLKVLLTSGFTSKSCVKNGLEKFATHLLSKPYGKTELAQRIRLVLDAQA